MLGTRSGERVFRRLPKNSVKVVSYYRKKLNILIVFVPSFVISPISPGHAYSEIAGFLANILKGAFSSGNCESELEAPHQRFNSRKEEKEKVYRTSLFSPRPRRDSYQSRSCHLHSGKYVVAVICRCLCLEEKITSSWNIN